MQDHSQEEPDTRQRTSSLVHNLDQQKLAMNMALMQARQHAMHLEQLVHSPRVRAPAGASEAQEAVHGCEAFVTDVCLSLDELSADSFADPLFADIVDLEELRVFCHEISDQFNEGFLSSEHDAAETLEEALNSLETAKESLELANQMLNAHIAPTEVCSLPMSELKQVCGPECVWA